jgi:hypothetical protein
MRLLYGAPPDRRTWRGLSGSPLPEELARTFRIENEKRELGKALFNLLAPLCGEEPLL